MTEPQVVEFIREHPGCQSADIVRAQRPKEPGMTVQGIASVVCGHVRKLLAEGQVVTRTAPHYITGKDCPCLFLRRMVL
jgi:hypothetical protein